jgi:hypothetical protein
MSIAEVKLELFRKINLLGTEQLNELTGLVENLLHETIDLDEWGALPTNIKKKSS